VRTASCTFSSSLTAPMASWLAASDMAQPPRR
jgi:hypothetical protein